MTRHCNDGEVPEVKNDLNPESFYPTFGVQIYHHTGTGFPSTITALSPLKMCSLRFSIICRMASCALTELPAASIGGEKAAIPKMPGSTPMIPPPTPDLAGMPQLNIQSPVRS